MSVVPLNTVLEDFRENQLLKEEKLGALSPGGLLNVRRQLGVGGGVAHIGN